MYFNLKYKLSKTFLYNILWYLFVTFFYNAALYVAAAKKNYSYCKQKFFFTHLLCCKVKRQKTTPNSNKK